MSHCCIIIIIIIICGSYIDSSCRYKVVGWLTKKFAQPKGAETFFSCHTSSIGVQTDQSVTSSCGVQTDKTVTMTSNAGVRTSKNVMTSVGIQSTVAPDLQSLSVMFAEHCKDKLQLEVSEDFLKLSVSAMTRLKNCHRSNVLYNLAKGVGTERPDQSDSCFPVLRMPMGLVEYITNFFACRDINLVG